MALNTAVLKHAGMENSKKDYLRDLAFFADKYNDLNSRLNANSATPQGKGEAVEYLYMVALRAATWLTHKPRNSQGKNPKRWDILADFMAEVGAECRKWGAKPPIGDFRNVADDMQWSRNYWLELLDPNHRSGGQLSGKWAEWQGTAQDWNQQRQTFFEWLDGKYPDSKNPDAKPSYWGTVKGYSGDSGLQNVEKSNEGTDKVAYRWEVSLEGNVLTDLSGPLTTEKMYTPTLTGWGIFVCTIDGTMFVTTGIAGDIHHTTMVGGRPILAAGEICVAGGKVCGMTNQSGHYHTSPDELRQCIRLMGFGCFPQMIVPKDFVANKQEWFRVGDFLNSNWKDKVLRDEINATLPNFGTPYVLTEWLKGLGMRQQVVGGY